jgi:hypothetical protein
MFSYTMDYSIHFMLKQEAPTAQSLCLCGHFFNAHSPFEPLVLSSELPAKGGCTKSGCTLFRSVGPGIQAIGSG